MKFKQMIVVALFAALMCIFSPIAVPFGPVPFSLATFIVYVTSGILGTKSVFAVMLYILIGGVGLPVFSYSTGGFEKLIGPTGGFIWGYLICALIGGYIVKRFYSSKLLTATGFLLGTLALSLIGTVWFALYTGGTFFASLFACAVVFIPAEIIKIICAVALLRIIRKRIDISKYI